MHWPERCLSKHDGHTGARQRRGTLGSNAPGICHSRSATSAGRHRPGSANGSAIRAAPGNPCRVCWPQSPANWRASSGISPGKHHCLPEVTRNTACAQRWRWQPKPGEPSTYVGKNIRSWREASPHRIWSGGNQPADESMITIGSDCRLQRHAQAIYFDYPASAGSSHRVGKTKNAHESIRFRPYPQLTPSS